MTGRAIERNKYQLIVTMMIEVVLDVIRKKIILNLNHFEQLELRGDGWYAEE